MLHHVVMTNMPRAQDELLDTVYWMRQLIALLCGIIWGGIPLKGLPAFLGWASRIIRSIGAYHLWVVMSRAVKVVGQHADHPPTCFSPDPCSVVDGTGLWR